jgi:hypothetical protein
MGKPVARRAAALQHWITSGTQTHTRRNRAACGDFRVHGHFAL